MPRSADHVMLQEQTDNYGGGGLLGAFQVLSGLPGLIGCGLGSRRCSERALT
jgi:hypothetical protein